MKRKVLLLVASIFGWAATVFPASAQHFKQIPGSLAQVAAGRSEVWGLDPSNQIYRFNSATTTFARVPGTLKLTQITVGGGTALQTDQVWGVNATGKIYKFNFKTNTFGHIPGTLAQIVVGEGYQDRCHPYEVWGLDAAELIYRYDSCSSQFVPIPGTLTHIAVGGGSVWGLNGAAQIYVYIFTQGDQGFHQISGSLQEIAVGVDAVWGVDGEHGLWQYSPHTGNFASLGLVSSTQIVAGGNGFWNALQDGSAARIQPTGGFRFTVPGFITQVAVGYGAGVWAVDSAHHVYSFARP